MMLDIKGFDLICMLLTTGMVFKQFITNWFGPQLSLFGDFPRIFYPWRVYAGRMLSNGDIPLWDPYTACGIDFIGRLETAVFYPVNLLLALLTGNSLTYFTFQLVSFSHFVFYGLACYLLLRTLGTNWPAATFVGIAAIGSAYHIPWAHAASNMASGAWLPLSLLFLFKAYKTHLFKHAGLAGAFLGMMLLAGQGQLAFYAGVSLGLIWLILLLLDLKTGAGRMILLFCIVVLIAVLLSGIQSLPALHLAMKSPRTSGDIAFAAAGQLSWNSLWNYILNLNTFLGALPLSLALIGLLGQRNRLLWALFLMAAWGAFYALGTNGPLMPWMVDHLPGFRLFRMTFRPLYITELAMFILAGFGLQWLYSKRSENASWSDWIPTAVMALGFALFLLIKNNILILWPWGLLLILTVIRNLKLAKTVQAGVWLIPVIALLFAFYQGDKVKPKWEKFPANMYFSENNKVKWIKARQKDTPLFRISKQGYLSNYDPRKWDPKTWPTAAATGLLFGIPTVDVYAELYDARIKYLARLTRQNPRLFDLMNVRYQIMVEDKIEPAMVKDYKYRPTELKPGERLELDLAGLYDHPAGKLEIITTMAHALAAPQASLVAMLTIKTREGRLKQLPLRAGIDTAEWAVDRPGSAAKHKRAKVFNSWPVDAGRYKGHTYIAEALFEPASQFDSLRLEFRGAHGLLKVKDIRLDGTSLFQLGKRWSRVAPSIWENNWCLPRSFIVHKHLVAHGNGQTEKMLQGLEPKLEAVLEENPPDGLAGKPSNSGESVKIISHEPERVELRAQLETPGLLLLCDAYDKGWEAFSNGRKVPVLRTNSYFRAVSLGAGEHHLVFVYRPLWFYAGLAMTLGGLIALLACFWLDKRFSVFSSLRRKAPPTDD